MVLILVLPWSRYPWSSKCLGLDTVCLDLDLGLVLVLIPLVLAMSWSWLGSHYCFGCGVPFCTIIFGIFWHFWFITAFSCRCLSQHLHKSGLLRKEVAGRTRLMLRRRFQGHKRTLPPNPYFKITNDKFTGEAAHFALCLCYFSLCLFSPTFFSCRLDSSKFRAVTLREGFWQRRVVMEDRLPLQVPCRENPGRAARRIAADDLRCCSAGCCRASSCASLVSARPSPARECLQSVRRCYFGVGVKEHL